MEPPPINSLSDHLTVWRLELGDALTHYRSQHTTLGCLLTHMFGVPMILASLPAAFICWQVALTLLVVGWVLQLIGHLVFERNRPVLMDGDPWTVVAALVFTAQEWMALLPKRGKPS
jgi:uncharacterized membrane protein YGL010W